MYKPPVRIVISTPRALRSGGRLILAATMATVGADARLTSSLGPGRAEENPPKGNRLRMP
jgi:hypothetical protein